MHTLIVCGGTPPSKKLLLTEVEKAELTLGADSGGYVFLGLGLYPDLVIGDLDSFTHTNHQKVPTLRDPDQDTNDLEKALHYALQQGATSCTVLGALGKRLDQTLKNVSVLLRFNSQFESLIFRDDYGDTFLVPSPYQLKYPVGTVVSFVPLGGPVTGFTSTGVKYPLTNSFLEMGVQDGTSNTIISEHAEVRFESGNLVVFVGNGDKINQ